MRLHTAKTQRQQQSAVKVHGKQDHRHVTHTTTFVAAKLGARKMSAYLFETIAVQADSPVSISRTLPKLA